jgi:hypothetical protein
MGEILSRNSQSKQGVDQETQRYRVIPGFHIGNERLDRPSDLGKFRLGEARRSRLVFRPPDSLSRSSA